MWYHISWGHFFLLAKYPRPQLVTMCFCLYQRNVTYFPIPLQHLLLLSNLTHLVVLNVFTNDKLFDVNNVFLYGDLDESVYVQLPLGFHWMREIGVCKLHKSLYFLKQASCQWFAKLSVALLGVGFLQSTSDCSLFSKIATTSFVAILIYVDGILVCSNDSSAFSFVKDYLFHHFALRGLRPLKYFLGLEVAPSKYGISLSQRKYALDILEIIGFLGSQPYTTPIEQNLQLYWWWTFTRSIYLSMPNWRFFFTYHNSSWHCFCCPSSKSIQG